MKNKKLTQEQIINNFLAGNIENEEELISATGTLKIKENQLIHYRTPIAEKSNGKIIVNISRYSLATGRLQKKLKEMIPPEQYITVKGVRENYRGSLSDFL